MGKYYEMTKHCSRAQSAHDTNTHCPPWHAEQVARLVQKEGVCVFWAETFSESVAFIKDETYLSAVPSGIVAYTEAELMELFGEDTAPKNQATWRLIHEAKKFGLIVNNVRKVE